VDGIDIQRLKDSIALLLIGQLQESMDASAALSPRYRTTRGFRVGAREFHDLPGKPWYTGR
jgi:hypothetical protein